MGTTANNLKENNNSEDTNKSTFIFAFKIFLILAVLYICMGFFLKQFNKRLENIKVQSELENTTTAKENESDIEKSMDLVMSLANKIYDPVISLESDDAKRNKKFGQLKKKKAQRENFSFISKCNITGVIEDGENTKIILNGNTYHMGQYIEGVYGLRFFGINPKNRKLVFQDKDSRIYIKFY